MFYLSFADIAEVSMNYLKKEGKIRLDESICSSRSFLQLVKSFFKKLFIFLKKSLMFLSNYSREFILHPYINLIENLVYIINLIIFANKKAGGIAGIYCFPLFKAISGL